MIKIYTDGSCLNNPGDGGWAAIINDNGKIIKISGSEKNTTNNKMELMATIKALQKITKNTKPEKIKNETDNWGANMIFEASGAVQAYNTIFDSICPAGRVIIVGNPMDNVPIDFATLLTKEVEIKTVFRYAHQYDRAIRLLSSNKIDVKPMITDTLLFDNSIKAFERAAKNLPNDVKLQILM